MKSSIIKHILSFVFMFLIVALTVTQVITLDRSLLAVMFFLILTVIVWWHQKDVLKEVFADIRLSRALVLFGFSITLHLVVSYLVINFLDKPDWPFDERGVSFLMMNSYFILTIPANVLFQQTLISGLIMDLVRDGLSLPKITKFLMMGFGLIHVFQIFRINVMIGLLFMFGAVIMAIALPYLLMKKKYGFMYNYMIHLAVYDLAALLAYVLY